jgi:hypothetical protein
MDATPLVMRNPPPGLLLVIPIGFLSVRTASLLWSAAMIACLMVSVRLIAEMHGRQKSQLNLLAYTFAPVLSCLIAGQMAIFVTLGLVLFLRFQGTRPLLAGASLWLCTLKPHLFLPFGVVLLAWIIVSKRYKVVVGTLLAFAASTAVVALMDPLAWTHYLHGIQAERIELKIIPCVSMILRLMIDRNAPWIQFVPAALGCVWALSYFRKHRRTWSWSGSDGSLLMMVSVLVAPYSWCLDQTVLLPALFYALYRNRSRGLVVVFALLNAVIEMGNFLGMPLRTLGLYLWTAPAWLVWYLCVIRLSGAEQRASGPSPSADGVAAVAETSTTPAWPI